MDDEKNKKKISVEELRLSYTEILEGVTKVSVEPLELPVALPQVKIRAFLKHPTAFDSSRVDIIRREALKKATSNGLPTIEEQTKYLIKEELWSEKEEDEIKTLSGFAVNLNASLKKMFLKVEQDKIKLKIKETEKIVQELTKKKDELLGLTAEGFASKKANEYYIFSGLFKERDCKTTFYTEEEYDTLSEYQLSKLVNVYNEVFSSFSTHNIKRISLMPYFLNGFYLCEDDPFVFFGNPIVKLTFHQISLFAQGKYFKAMIAQSKTPPPEEIENDPDELIAWFDQSKEADEAMTKLEQKEGKSAESAKEQSGTKSTSLVGATSEDLQKLGIGQGEEGGVNLAKEAKKKGGNLNMQDLIKLHGVGKN